MKRTIPLQVDPIIFWPTEVAELRPIIGELQRLNPKLNLRCAIDHWERPYRTIDGDRDGGTEVDETEDSYDFEYLVYDGTALDVVPITMPELTPDLLGGLSEMNHEVWDVKTDLGPFVRGLRRFEGTADGLLIRPRSENVRRAIAIFRDHEEEAERKAQAELRAAYRERIQQGFGIRDHQDEPQRKARVKRRADYGPRIQRGFGIWRGLGEIWEVDFAYMPANDFDWPDGTPKDSIEWWSTTPIGTISYIDHYDLPIENHYERARKTVEAGSAFAIVGDLLVGDLRIFRKSGEKRVTKGVQIPEMPWFKVPVVKIDKVLDRRETQSRQPKRSI